MLGPTIPSLEIARKAILLLSETLSAPASDADGSVRRLLQALTRDLELVDACAVLTVRVAPDPQDPFLGWRPGWLIHLDPEVERSGPDADSLSAERYADAPCAQRVVAEAGAHRVYMHPLTKADWAVPHAQSLPRAERMVAIHNLTPEVELYLNLDRGPDRPPFSENERRLLELVVVGLRPLTRRLALLHGHLKRRRALSPRHHLTLKHLLDGLSEKEVADRMGLSRGTVHQYVVAIYRHFGVQSRGELMALWLGAGPG